MLKPRVIFQFKSREGDVLDKNLVLGLLAEEFATGKWDSYDAGGYDFEYVFTSALGSWPEDHPDFLEILKDFMVKHRSTQEIHVSLESKPWSDFDLSLLAGAAVQLTAYITNETSYENISRLIDLYPQQVCLRYQAVGDKLENPLAQFEVQDSLVIDHIAHLALHDNPFVCLNRDHGHKFYYVRADGQVAPLCNDPPKSASPRLKLTAGHFYSWIWNNPYVAEVEAARATGVCPSCGQPVESDAHKLPPLVEVGTVTGDYNN